MALGTVREGAPYVQLYSALPCVASTRGAVASWQGLGEWCQDGAERGTRIPSPLYCGVAASRHRQREFTGMVEETDRY